MTTRTNRPITQDDLRRGHQEGVQRCFASLRSAADGGHPPHCKCSICKLVSEIEKQGVIKNAPNVRRDIQRAHKQGMKRCLEEVRDAAKGHHPRHCECVACKLVAKIETQGVRKMQIAAQNLVVEKVQVGEDPNPDPDAAQAWVVTNVEKVDDSSIALSTDALWDAVKKSAKAASTFHDGDRPLAYGKSRHWYSRRVIAFFDLPKARVEAGTGGQGRELVGVRVRVYEPTEAQYDQDQSVDRH